ncbi:MAG TPA: exosortase/archaeosortase family protein [Longimicrobiales bacterium]|nr:exosortase/archaeosortase family protein [Longimicrobiales bacterium]
MTDVARTRPLRSLTMAADRVWPALFTLVAFVALFHTAMATLARDWWSDPDAGHGLLLAPVALWLAWRRGLLPSRVPQPRLGAILLVAAIALRYVAGLAAELFTLRFSLVAALAALVVFYFGYRQLLHWWLPATLLVLAVPLPSVVLSSLALPLQLQASEFGAAMLESRHVPVLLAGNVIHLPGRSLFVTEACSGLRSLTSLVALGVLIGGIWLRTPTLRIMIVLLALPIAMLLNGVRIFLTGFLVYFVDPKLGDGLMHYTEGWAMFVVAFVLLGAMAWLLTHAEQFYFQRKAAA